MAPHSKAWRAGAELGVLTADLNASNKKPTGKLSTAGARALSNSSTFALQSELPDFVTVGELMGNGHLGGRGAVAAGGDRGVRQAHPPFQHLWRQPGVLRHGPCGSESHQGRPAAGADQRETGHEGQILKIRPPLVFSSKDAKLFLATLDEMLAALWRTPPAGLPVQARGQWDQGRLIEPTRSVSAPFAALSTTLSGENTANGQWQRSFDCRVRC